MDYPTRTRKPKRKAPKAKGSQDRFQLRLAEYSAPFGEELPWRIAESDLPELAVASHEWRPERGSLH